jgi:cell division transport system permease protein
MNKKASATRHSHTKQSTPKERVPDSKTGIGASRSAIKGGHSWFQQHQEVAVDSLVRLLGEPGSSLLTWSVIGIALALPLCLLLFMQNIQQLNTNLDEAGNISLFMQLDISNDMLVRVQSDIEEMEQVIRVSAVTAEQALVEFQENSGFGNALEGLDENPLPALLIVTPSEAGRESLSALASELEAMAEVDSAQVDLEWIQRLYSIINLAERFTTGLALLLCLGVILAVGNTVRLAIENRRDEIMVVKLVGGTDAYVARPFLYTGIWFGIGGGMIATVLVMLAFLLLSGPVTGLMSLYGSDFNLTGLTASDLLILLATSGGLGLVGAWISVVRHLRLIEPQ